MEVVRSQITKTCEYSRFVAERLAAGDDPNEILDGLRWALRVAVAVKGDLRLNRWQRYEPDLVCPFCGHDAAEFGVVCTRRKACRENAGPLMLRREWAAQHAAPA